MDKDSLRFILTAEELNSGSWLENLNLDERSATEVEYKKLLAVCVGSQHLSLDCQAFDFEKGHQETQAKLVRGTGNSGEWCWRREGSSGWSNLY